MNKPELPPFLGRLGLGPDADARAIRRAYARELKLVDQESDAAGFQSLREHYESALQWAEFKQWELVHGSDDEADGGILAALPSDAGDVTVAIPAAVSLAKPVATATGPDPEQLADAAFLRLTEACQTLVAQNGGGSLPAWEQAIRAELGNSDLFNIAASTAFEGRIVAWLAQGWAPGKENLFAVAPKVFQWQQDGRRLTQFGYPGDFVNEAMDERTVFLRQSMADVDTYRAVIERVRTTPDPAYGQLRYDMLYLEQLLTRFPAMMHLCVDTATVERWRAVFRDNGGVITPTHVVADPDNSGGSFPWWYLIFAACMLLRMCGGSGSSSSYTAPPPPAPPVVAAVYGAFDQTAIDAINAQVHYTFPDVAARGTYTVRYDVILDQDGKVFSFLDRQHSGFAGLDEEVQAAIRRAQPFPGLQGKIAPFTYTATVK